jgi:hypothetical protein
MVALSVMGFPCFAGFGLTVWFVMVTAKRHLSSPCLLVWAADLLRHSLECLKEGPEPVRCY